MSNKSLVELIVLMVAVIILTLTPMFLFAGSIGYDEFLKSGVGVLAGVSAAVGGIYRVWKSVNRDCSEE